MKKWQKKWIRCFALQCLVASVMLLSRMSEAVLAVGSDWDWYPTDEGIYTRVDGTDYWLSLDTEELTEYADLLGEELKLPTAAVAGILANIQTESGFDANKVGDGGSAYGLCQWRGARLDAMVEYCDAEGINPVTADGQLAYLIHDLQEHYIYAYDLLLDECADSEEGCIRAAFYFCSQYEAPVNAEEVSPPREELAKNLVYPLLKELREEN